MWWAEYLRGLDMSCFYELILPPPPKFFPTLHTATCVVFMSYVLEWGHYLTNKSHIRIITTFPGVDVHYRQQEVYIYGSPNHDQQHNLSKVPYYMLSIWSISFNHEFLICNTWQIYQSTNAILLSELHAYYAWITSIFFCEHPKDEVYWIRLLHTLMRPARQCTSMPSGIIPRFSCSLTSSSSLFSAFILKIPSACSHKKQPG